MSDFIYESPAQHERDFRSANKDWKRSKDASTKWALGGDVMPGVQVNFVGEVTNNATEAQLAHVRPCKAHQRRGKKEHNIVKMRSHHDMPAGRVKSKSHAYEEISATSRSITDLLPLPSALSQTPTLRSASSGVMDNFLYSFDRTDTTPRRPLSLDIFVKEAPRATERQVEREYEVLDHNGEVLRGRKVRHHLRQHGHPGGPAADDVALEDEDFQLV